MKAKNKVKNKNTIVKEDIGSEELVKIVGEEIVNLRNRIKTARQWLKMVINMYKYKNLE